MNRAHRSLRCPDIAIRPAAADDRELLSRMFVQAAYWRPEWPRPELREILQRPELARYFADWGRPTDVAFVAVEADGRSVGAAWFRLFTAEEPGYGYVGADIPEIGIAVEAASRGRGIGRLLIERLQDEAIRRGYAGLSLSVHPENPALRLYERAGFERIGGSALTMLWRVA